MKIKYNVLWVENEQDWLDSIVDEIQEFVEELGFKFSYDVATGRSDISDYNKYDLILMDLNLASEPTGDPRNPQFEYLHRRSVLFGKRNFGNKSKR